MLGVDCLCALLNDGHYFMTLSLNFFAADTEAFVRPNLKFGVDGFPKVNESLKFVKLDVLKIFGFVINDDSGLRIDKLLDNLEKVIEAVDFFEESFIVSEEFIQEVMGQNISQ